MNRRSSALLLAVVTALAQLVTTPSFSQDSILVQEAERDLTEIDCSISRLSAEIYDRGNDVASVIQEQVAAVDVRDAYFLRKQRQYMGELTGDSPMDGLDDKVDIASPLEGGEVLKRAIGIIEVIDGWQKAIEKIQDYQKLRAMQYEIDGRRVSFEELRQQIDTAAKSVSGLRSLRGTKTSQWNARGVNFSRSFYGLPGDCVGPGAFDGVWASDDFSRPEFEVRGDRFTLPEDRVAWSGSRPCHQSNDNIVYRSSTEASITFNFEPRRVCRRPFSLS